MTGRTTVWGIHPLNGRDFAATGGLLVIERPGVGDLRQYGGDRGRLKASLTASYPKAASRTVAQWTGTLLRFAVLARDGDLVVHPNPVHRKLSVGRLVGPYFWQDGHPVDQHLRRVQWLERDISRDVLSPIALKSVSGRAAFFSADAAADELVALAGPARPS